VCLSLTEGGLSSAWGEFEGVANPGDFDRTISRRKFDVVIAWAIDCVGRCLIDLLSTIPHLEAAGVDCYLGAQNIDTTTPMGRLLFPVVGAFAEFERSMIRQRVQVGLNSIKTKIAKDGSSRPRLGSLADVSAAQGPSRSS